MLPSKKKLEQCYGCQITHEEIEHATKNELLRLEKLLIQLIDDVRDTHEIHEEIETFVPPGCTESAVDTLDPHNEPKCVEDRRHESK